MVKVTLSNSDDVSKILSTKIFKLDAELQKLNHLTKTNLVQNFILNNVKNVGN